MTPQDTEAMSHGQARSGSRRALQATTCLAAAWLAALGCGDGMPTMPNPPTGAEFTLSQAQVSAMNTRAGHLADANPGNGSLQSLVDSTLLALQAGVVMKRVDVQTDLTTAPLYFVGLHRVIHQAGGGSFSTWTLVGFEDPAAFANVIQVTGFAQSASATAPSSVNGTIGDGMGIVNGQLLQVGAANSLTTWNVSTGTASFSSDAPSGPCPNGNPEPKTVCTLETMHVTFSITAAQLGAASPTRHATVTTEVAVPTIRLTYTP
ncbi:MAG: hypothetical protein IPP98_00300 [Gemmatimonadetes bacterium]|nr:hypothetical protein [Gemmatimonadota bacterium]MBL0177559.1 hypothetical protein [Gemmatimonadota bacterium]